MGERGRSLGPWEQRGRRDTNSKDSVLCSTDPTSKARGQAAPGEGTFGCWEWFSRLICRHFFLEEEGAVSVLTNPLGQELHQAADGRGGWMVVRLEPSHIGAPAALVL